MTQTYLDSFVKEQKQPKKEKAILKELKKIKSKPKKHVTVNEMFWWTPNERKQIEKEFEVIYV